MECAILSLSHNIFTLQIDSTMFKDSNGPQYCVFFLFLYELILQMSNDVFLHFSITIFPNIVAVTSVAVGVSVPVFPILFSVLISFIIY